MPSETFFRLSAQKRTSFLDVSLLEFALNDYQSASISRIVVDLGIAKGSVYQYFADKKELYFFLLQTAVDRKFTFISERISDESNDFYSRLRDMICLGSWYDLTHPAHGLIIMNAMRSPRLPELGDLAGDLTRQSVEFLAAYVEAAIEDGAIRSDVPSGLITYLVNAATIHVGEYLERTYDFSVIDRLTGSSTETAQSLDPALPFTREELETEVSNLILLLKEGLTPR